MIKNLFQIFIWIIIQLITIQLIHAATTRFQASIDFAKTLSQIKRPQDHIEDILDSKENISLDLDYKTAQKDKHYLDSTAMQSPAYHRIIKQASALKEVQQRNQSTVDTYRSLRDQLLKRTEVKNIDPQIPCGQGDCQIISGHSSEKQFAENVSKINALIASSKQFSESTKRIFEGTPAKCHKVDSLGIDCCHFDGWNSQCSESEKSLSDSIASGQTILVGQHHDKKNAYVNIFDYCVFSSKMAKIIQEQGRLQQLGISLSQATCYRWKGHHCKRYRQIPNCRGITPEELQKIHFDDIRFDELYQKVHQDYQSIDKDTVFKKKHWDKWQ